MRYSSQRTSAVPRLRDLPIPCDAAQGVCDSSADAPTLISMSVQCYDGKIVERALPAAGEAEMPPFARVVFEAMAGEQDNQHPSCVLYFGRELRSCRVRHRVKTVECGSH